MSENCFTEIQITGIPEKKYRNKNYRHKNYRNKEIYITETQIYKFQKYINTNYRSAKNKLKEFRNTSKTKVHI